MVYGQTMLDAFYDLLLPTLSIQNHRIQTINAFLGEMLRIESGVKTAVQLVNRRIESRGNDGYDAMGAFRFLEAILIHQGPGQAEFCQGLCDHGFSAVLLERTALNHGSLADLMIKERALKFIKSALVSNTSELLKQKLRLIQDKFPQGWATPMSMSGVKEQTPGPKTTTTTDVRKGKRKHPDQESGSSSSSKQSQTIRCSVICNADQGKKFEIKRLAAFCPELLCELWRAKNFTDVTFVCSNGKIEAHKAIVSVRSRVFHTMILSAMKSAPLAPTTINVGAHKVETINSLLKFIYTGCVNPPSRDAIIALIRAADQYKMDDLKNACFRLLVEDTTNVSEEFGELLILSHKCHAWDSIKHDIQQFLMRNKTELMNLPGFQKLVADSPTEFAAISLGTFLKK